MIFTSALLSAFSGTISGIFGHWFKGKEDKDKRIHEKEMYELSMKRDTLDSELRIKELDAQLKVTETEMEGNLLIEESKGFNEAVTEISKNKLGSSTLNYLVKGNWLMKFFGVQIAYLLGLTDVIRGLIRPLVTVCSVGVLLYLGTTIGLEQISTLSIEQKYGITMLLLDAIIFIVTSSISFWFMSRGQARDFNKKH